MVRKQGSRAMYTVNRVAEAATKAAAAKLSRLSDEELAEIEEKYLNEAYLYTESDMPYEDWRHIAHYQAFRYAWVVAVLSAVVELRQRRQRERIRALEEELASV